MHAQYAKKILSVQYGRILNGLGIGKYYSKNIKCIINIYIINMISYWARCARQLIFTPMVLINCHVAVVATGGLSYNDIHDRFNPRAVKTQYKATST